MLSAFKVFLFGHDQYKNRVFVVHRLLDTCFLGNVGSQVTALRQKHVGVCLPPGGKTKKRER